MRILPRSPGLVPRAPVARALPGRFRRERWLITGCGDIGMRVLELLSGRAKVFALTSSEGRVPELRRARAHPVLGDLDQPRSLRRLAGLATRVLQLAPPAAKGGEAHRERALRATLARRQAPRTVVYVSTSAVYGDCQGAWVTETRAPEPASAAGRRRLAAERVWRGWGRAPSRPRVSVLRVPGIYAPTRSRAAVLQRLGSRQPVLVAHEDVYTNHIHADDMSRACLRALFLGRPARVTNVADDTRLKMGAYYDFLAAALGLPCPPRVSRDVLLPTLSESARRFWIESRCLSNGRLKHELRLRLRYATVAEGWGECQGVHRTGSCSTL